MRDNAGCSYNAAQRLKKGWLPGAAVRHCSFATCGAVTLQDLNAVGAGLRAVQLPWQGRFLAVSFLAATGRVYVHEGVLSGHGHQVLRHAMLASGTARSASFAKHHCLCTVFPFSTRRF